MEINKIHQMDVLDGLNKIKDHTIDMGIVDPPYNVGIDEWDKIKDYKEFCRKWLNEVVRVIKPNKAIWIFGNQHSIHLIRDILDGNNDVRFRSQIIWNKGVGIPNPHKFSNLYEQILYYIKVPSPKILNKFGSYIKSKRTELKISLKEIGKLCGEEWYHRGGHLYFETGLVIPTVKQYIKLKEVLNLDDRYDFYFNNHFIFDLESIGVKWKYDKDKRNKRGWKNCGDVWNISQLSGTFKERLDHPTQKPIKLIDRMIKVSSRENDLILDLFSGTGTTSVVCKQLNRRYIGFELEHKYIEIANKRLSQETLHSLSEIQSGDDGGINFTQNPTDSGFSKGKTPLIIAKSDKSSEDLPSSVPDELLLTQKGLS